MNSGIIFLGQNKEKAGQKNHKNLHDVGIRKRVLKKGRRGSSLAVQWVGLGSFTAMAPGSIPDQELR